jgi:hypothetical protein
MLTTPQRRLMIEKSIFMGWLSSKSRCTYKFYKNFIWGFKGLYLWRLLVYGYYGNY